MLDEMSTVREAAKFLGLQINNLNQMRYRDTGPRWVRVGTRSVRYLSGDLAEYKALREKVTVGRK
jgi:predicted DNA-binding transcriptional regulator AlpA